MALYIPHSIFHLALLLYVRWETFGPPYYIPLRLLWAYVTFSRVDFTFITQWYTRIIPSSTPISLKWSPTFIFPQCNVTMNAPRNNQHNKLIPSLPPVFLQSETAASFVILWFHMYFVSDILFHIVPRIPQSTSFLKTTDPFFTSE